MGRGLSTLQQQILRLAWEREQTTTSRVAQRRLFPQEIYRRLWHWPITYKGYFWERQDGLAFRGSRHFSPAVIGPKRYPAAMVSVSRALDRLYRRGLVVRYSYAGWRLTAKGRLVAQALTVDNDDKKMVK